MSPLRCYSLIAVSSERVTVEVLEAQLQGSGFRVRGVRTSREAMAEVRRELPDVVLADLRLAGESGLALLQQLRSSEQTIDLPVVIVAPQDGNSRRPTVVEAIRLGASDIVSRPLDVGLLREKLLMLVQLREMAQKRNRTMQMLTENLDGPVQSIHGLSSLLLREHFGAMPSEQAVRALHALSNACDHLRLQTRQLLGFLRPEDEVFHLELQRVSLQDLLLSIRKDMEGTGLRFEPVTRRLPEVVCDRQGIRRAIAFLLRTLQEFLPAADDGFSAALDSREEEGSFHFSFLLNRPAFGPDEMRSLLRRLSAPLRGEESGHSPSFLQIVMEGHGGLLELGSNEDRPGMELRLTIPARQASPEL